MDDLIKTMNLSALTNNLYAQFMADVDCQVVRVTPEALKVVNCYNSFKEGRLLFDTVYISQRKDNRTVPLATLDDKRKSVYSSFHMHVKAELHSTDSTRKEQATILYNRIESYGKITRMGATAASAEITDLCKTLATDEYQEIIEALGLTDDVTSLEDLNNQYISLSRERTESGKIVTVSTVQARKGLDPLYRRLIAVVNAQITINNYMDVVPTEPEEDEPVVQAAVENPLEDFALSINAIISEYKQKLLNRVKSQKRTNPLHPRTLLLPMQIPRQLRTTPMPRL